jgi:hypothetical protein
VEKANVAAAISAVPWARACARRATRRARCASIDAVSVPKPLLYAAKAAFSVTVDASTRTLAAR